MAGEVDGGDRLTGGDLQIARQPLVARGVLGIAAHVLPLTAHDGAVRSEARPSLDFGVGRVLEIGVLEPFAAGIDLRRNGNLQSFGEGQRIERIGKAVGVPGLVEVGVEERQRRGERLGVRQTGSKELVDRHIQPRGLFIVEVIFDARAGAHGLGVVDRPPDIHLLSVKAAGPDFIEDDPVTVGVNVAKPGVPVAVGIAAESVVAIDLFGLGSVGKKQGEQFGVLHGGEAGFDVGHRGNRGRSSETPGVPGTL